jgi:hypothetical protein
MASRTGDSSDLPFAGKNQRLLERCGPPWGGEKAYPENAAEGKSCEHPGFFFLRPVDFRDFARRTSEPTLLEGETTMQYLLLIYESEADWNAIAETERQKIYKEYRELSADLQKNGNYKVGQQLQPTSTATTVRERNGKKTITDGPFAETKEQLGGFYFVEAKDLDEALAIAARIPSVRTGSIEVRPIVVH